MEVRSALSFLCLRTTYWLWWLVKLHAARAVSNALDSPSVVVLSNTNYESNPMDSPSVVINGQASAG